MPDYQKCLVNLLKTLLLVNLMVFFLTFSFAKHKQLYLHYIQSEAIDYFLLVPYSSVYYFYRNGQLIYDFVQYKHTIKTNVSFELFMKMVERGQLKRARHANFHNINDCNNVKYLSLDGRYEYIIKVAYNDAGEMVFVDFVRDGINRGTYNLFNQEGSKVARSLHKIDVYLWVLFGTGIDDPSSIIERLNFFLFRKPQGCVRS